MPAGFVHCYKNGGKVSTIHFGGNRYRRICKLGGKTYEGEVHTKKSARRIKSN